jgi:hypothetical protein
LVHPLESDPPTAGTSSTEPQGQVEAAHFWDPRDDENTTGRIQTPDEAGACDVDANQADQYAALAHEEPAKSGALPASLEAERDLYILQSPRQPREEWDLPPLQLCEAVFRHSGWKKQRRETFEALCRVQPGSMATYRFSVCGCGAFIQESVPGTTAPAQASGQVGIPLVAARTPLTSSPTPQQASGSAGSCAAKPRQVRCVANTCHHRLCVPCQRSVGRIVQQNLREHMKGKTARFVTLTLRHSNTPLRDQIDRLMKSWQALRRRKDIAPAFVGGVAILETKVSERDGLWHVHLHILTEGCWLDHRDLSSAWHAITGDSSITDIRAVGDNERGIAYVTKYISKPLDASLYGNQVKLDEYITAIAGRKTMATYGTWRGLKLKAPPVDDTVWRTIMSFTDFVAAVRRRDAAALDLLRLLRHEQEDAAPSPRMREPGEDDPDG